MPKDTFENLNNEKRNTLINAFLYEFTTHTYDDASLSSVVKQLGIAKGSVYQYFNDKLDLFTYLIQECNRLKINYTLSVKRELYNSFWDYFKSIVLANIKFDKENPKHSNFLFCLEDNLNSKSTRFLYNEFKTQILKAYESLVLNEVAKGNFRDDISTEILSHFLYTTTLSVNKHFASKYNIDFREYAEKSKSVFDGRIDEYKIIIDEHLLLLQTAFRKE